MNEIRKRKIIVVGIMLLFLIIGLSGCITETSIKQTVYNESPVCNIEKFDVHEWGVFLKGYNCTDAIVATNSSEWFGVRKPVIYFHSLENLTNVSVEIQSIINATVIPNATIENDTILWNVNVENNTIELHNDTQYPYLFYEGETTCNSAIIANITWSEDTIKYCIKNNANYTISNVFFILINHGRFYTSEDDWFEYVYFGDLDPGNEISITNTTTENFVNLTEAKKIIQNALISKGLTISESNELINYWSSYIFSPSNSGIFTRVLYLIPQSFYDQLLPISITPQPEMIKRVGLFTITDIPIEFS